MDDCLPTYRTISKSNYRPREFIHPVKRVDPACMVRSIYNLNEREKFYQYNIEHKVERQTCEVVCNMYSRVFGAEAYSS
jgi:hypothetical protein